MLEIPFISIGSPSRFEQYFNNLISLDKYMIKNPISTFMAYVEGDSMIGKGLHHGDMLIIDRSLDPIEGDIVVAILNGEFVVKELSMIDNKIYLVSVDSNYVPIKISKEIDCQIWGVVSFSIYRYR